MACQIFYIPTDARWQKINSVLSGRLELGCFGWRDYGFSLLGTKIEWIGFSHNATAGAYNYVDCSYMQILLENGLIPLVIIIVVYTYIMYMAVKEKDFYLQTAVLLITAFSITEPRLLNLAYNPLPFFGITYISLRGRSAGRPPSEPACAVSYHTCEAEGKKVTTMNEYRNNENE